MAKQLFSNNAETALAAQLAVGATSLQLPAGKGALFSGPNPALGEFEAVTLATPSYYEVLHITQRGDLVAQEANVTPGGTIVAGASQFVLTLYDDNGDPHQISYQAVDNTVAGAVAGLYSIWTAQTASPWTDYTVADNTTALHVTKNMAGVPFTLTGAASGGGSETLLVSTTVQAVAGQGDVLTVQRAQEGTTARQWEIGTVVSGRNTKATMEALRDGITEAKAAAAAAVYNPRPEFVDLGDMGVDGTIDISQAHTIRVRVTGDINVTLSGWTEGQATRLCFVQDSVGNHLVSIANASHWGDASPPVIQALAGKMATIGLLCLKVDGVTQDYVGMAYTVNM